MLSFDPMNNTEKEDYKLLTSSVIPRPIAFVTSMTRNRVLNGAPFSYFNALSANPPLLSLAISRRDGVPKDTARNIMDQKEFVVHIVDETYIDKVDQTSIFLPPDESEVELAKLTPVNSTAISVPGVREAKIRFECKLEQHLEIKGRNEVETDLIIGRVVRYHIDNDLYENGEVSHEKLNAISAMKGSVYAKTGQTFSIDHTAGSDT